MTTREREVRAFAEHGADLKVIRRGGKLWLYERHGERTGLGVYRKRRRLGSYRSWASVERAVIEYGNARWGAAS